MQIRRVFVLTAFSVFQVGVVGGAFNRKAMTFEIVLRASLSGVSLTQAL